jgi:cytochrome c-type biogenesis protein
MRTMTHRLRLPLILLGGTLLLLVLKEYVPGVRALASDLYLLASSINATLAEPINNVRLGLGIPAIGAFLLGLLAATAPCQLSTNTAAIAYFSKDAVQGRGWSRVLLFLFGKTLVYMALAGIAVWVSGGDFGVPTALFVSVRRLLGPLMILLGLVMLGWLRPRLALPLGAAMRLQTWAEARGGAVGALSLGIAFGLAFCPTLFLLFFGLMLPTAVASSTGVLFPALFALGTAVPLLLMLALIDSVAPKREVTGGMRRANRLLSSIAGFILVLTGLYDTVVYWFI